VLIPTKIAGYEAKGTGRALVRYLPLATSATIGTNSISGLDGGRPEILAMVAE